MGATSSSVKDLTQKEFYDDIKAKAAVDPQKEKDLEWAYRQAVKNAIVRSNTVKAIIAQEVDRLILTPYRAANPNPGDNNWPFQDGVKPDPVV